MKRVYHHFSKLEEHQHRMWRIVPAGEEREALKAAAAALMVNTEAFRVAMRRAVNEWPYSCEHNLTCRAINRRAWLGHAGTCLATGAPEEITRFSWHTLTQAQQNAADIAALDVIAEWENDYVARLPKPGDRARGESTNAQEDHVEAHSSDSHRAGSAGRARGAASVSSQ